MLGQSLTATLRQIVPYGLWLQHQDAAILVKIVDISWGRAPSLEETFTVGEQLLVKVTHQITDPAYVARSPLKVAGCSISAVWVGSIKALHPEDDPWREPLPFWLGQRVEGVISAVASYGIFVIIAPHVEGLLRTPPGAQSSLAPGDRCVVRVTELRVSERKVGLEFIEDEAKLA